jgi:hypothetical protein
VDLGHLGIGAPGMEDTRCSGGTRSVKVFCGQSVAVLVARVSQKDATEVPRHDVHERKPLIQLASEPVQRFSIVDRPTGRQSK